MEAVLRNCEGSRDFSVEAALLRCYIEKLTLLFRFLFSLIAKLNYLVLLHFPS